MHPKFHTIQSLIHTISRNNVIDPKQVNINSSLINIDSCAVDDSKFQFNSNSASVGVKAPGIIPQLLVLEPMPTDVKAICVLDVVSVG
jgi:hypothetical protein